MAELQRDEAGLRGVRRILCAWIAHAADSLHKKKVTDADVHEARKDVKKSRAALRLLRNALGQSVYERENAALRAAARPLGIVRDGKVLLTSLDKLVEGYAPTARSLPLGKLRRVLRKELTGARRAVTPAVLKRQRKVLQEVLDRSTRWRIGGDDWQMLGAGLERVYRSGRKKFQAARLRDTEQLHEWRKQVKYLWHQLQVLQPVRPGRVGELADQAHKLADYLGDDHDLAVLRQQVVDNDSVFVDPTDRDVLLQLLDRCRRQLQDKALVLGERIFEPKPRQFVRRVGKYWNAWRTEDTKRRSAATSAAAISAA
jgi:CHAD domain-containing protein